MRRATERHHLGQRAAGQRRLCRSRQVGVGRGRAAHGLGGVVDEDVQRPGGGHIVGERDHLRGVAQVDPDDSQPVKPIGAVVHRREALDRVVREPRRDRRMGAVAQQPQRDVHPDLGPAAREQRPAPGQVGAGGAALVVQGGAGGAQLVVEGVDVPVAALADVARPGAHERTRRVGRGAGGQRQPPGLVVDPPGRAGRRRGRHRLVVRADRRPPLGPAPFLDGLEQPADRAPDGDRVGVLGREPLDLGQDAEGIGKAVGIDAVHVRTQRSRRATRRNSTRRRELHREWS
jgi:hypothetical protein